MLAYHTPDTLEETLSLRAEHGSTSMVMAGGTIVMNLVNEGLDLPGVVIGLKRAGLDTVEPGDAVRTIGATTTLATLTSDSNSLIADAATACGGWAIRNMGTVGGNLFAPAPAGDLGVALLALDASLRFSTSQETRVVPLADFFARGRTVGNTEVLTGIEIPERRTRTAFVKFGRKSGSTPSVVTVALSLGLEGALITSARVALGAMGPHPRRAERAESLLAENELSPQLIGEVAAEVAEELPGMTDAIASAWYRRRMATVHVQRLLESLAPLEEDAA